MGDVPGEDDSGALLDRRRGDPDVEIEDGVKGV